MKDAKTVRNELYLWNFAYWDAFSSLVYSKTLNKSNLTGRGERLHQDELYEISDDGQSGLYTFENPRDHYFYKMQNESDNFILPERFKDALPIIPKEWIDMKLTSSDSKVWKMIIDFDSFKIPEKRNGSLKEFVVKFNPMSNSNMSSATILKLISLCRGLKIAVCGDYSVGKNANYNIKSSIQNNAFSGLKNCSEAMFHKICVFNDDINIDEITTWTKTKLEAIEDKLATYGDQSSKTHKHATDAKKSNEMIHNVNSKSFIITFNPYDAKNHPRYFGENMGNPGKIKDRYPFIYLKGGVLDSIPNPIAGTEEKVVLDNLSFYQEIASEFMYWRNNYDKHMHGYDRSALVFKKRKLTNINPLINIIDAFSDTKAEFDYWIEFLNTAENDYRVMESGRKTTKVESVPGVFEEYIGD